MEGDQQLLTPQAIEALVLSVTAGGKQQLAAIEAERLLNAVARAQAGVPTGGQIPSGRNTQ